MEKINKNNIKKRNWAMVIYPESLPDNWKEILQNTGLPIVISPLHDKDLNPTGEPKKAHYHLILCYSGPTSFNVVKKISDNLNAPIPIALEQIKGYYRYLTHKDNPEKYQYDEKDIETLNNFNIYDYVEISKSEALELKIKIQDIILEKDFLEYSDLLIYLRQMEMFVEYDFASNHTILFNGFIKSLKFKRKEQQQ